MRESWITGLAGQNPGKRWSLWVRKGLRVPGDSRHAHSHEPGIHRNTLLSEGQLITSAADIGFNICVLIYLTSAEHPKKIFKYRMGNPAAFWVHRISHTPSSNVFSFAKLKMHFAKHVLCSCLFRREFNPYAADAFTLNSSKCFTRVIWCPRNLLSLFYKPLQAHFASKQEVACY